MRRYLNPVSFAYACALLAFTAWWVFHLGTWVLNVGLIALLPAPYICGRYSLRSWGAREWVLHLTVILSLVLVVLETVLGVLVIERRTFGLWGVAWNWISIAAGFLYACLSLMWLKPRWVVRALGGPTNAWLAVRERSEIYDEQAAGWDSESGAFSPDWLVRIKMLDRYRDKDTAAYIDTFQSYYFDYPRLASDPDARETWLAEWDRVARALNRSLGARPGWMPAATKSDAGARVSDPPVGGTQPGGD
jgi:hypothetical protein